MLRPFLLRSFVLVAALTAGGATADAQPATETPTFRAGVDLVPLTAVVRDGRQEDERTQQVGPQHRQGSGLVRTIGA